MQSIPVVLVPLERDARVPSEWRTPRPCILPAWLAASTVDRPLSDHKGMHPPTGAILPRPEGRGRMAPVGGKERIDDAETRNAKAGSNRTAQQQHRHRDRECEGELHSVRPEVHQ